MFKFEKIAEIRTVSGKVTKEVVEALVDKGFYLCLDGNYAMDGCDFIVMKKASDEN